MYRVICFLIKVFLPLITRIEVHNLDRLPRSGGYIAASNHLGRLDAPLVYYFLDRDDVILIVAEKYQKYAVFRWLARQLNAIFIDRSNADVSTLREILKRLKQGGVLAVAPEGTRSKTHALLEGRPGVSYMAVKANLPIFPIGATGTEDAVVKAKWLHLKRPHVIVHVGEPFRLPPLDKRDREAALEKNTDEIMCQIAALLPESHRGVYADHPRLRELLQERNLHTSTSESSEN